MKIVIQYIVIIKGVVIVNICFCRVGERKRERKKETERVTENIFFLFSLMIKSINNMLTH